MIAQDLRVFLATAPSKSVPCQIKSEALLIWRDLSGTLLESVVLVAERTLTLGTPGQTQNLHYLVSSRLSTDPTLVIKKAFPDGPTVTSRPRVGVVSSTPK